MDEEIDLSELDDLDRDEPHHVFCAVCQPNQVMLTYSVGLCGQRTLIRRPTRPVRDVPLDELEKLGCKECLWIAVMPHIFKPHPRGCWCGRGER